MNDRPQGSGLPPELNPRGLSARPQGAAPVPLAGGSATGGGGGTLYGGARPPAEPSGPKPPPDARRIAGWIALALSVCVLVGSAGAYGYVQYVGTKFTHISLCTGKDCKHPAEKAGQENFLLVGSDTRSGDNSTGALKGLANGTSGFGLSDSVMLIHLAANSNRVTVLSFPRDMLVQRPSYTTKSGSVVPAAAAKFNAAFSIGGPPLLVKQVEQVSGLRVDHFVQVDFHGFIGVVNALGGINVCIAKVPGFTNWIDPGIPGVTGGSGFKGKPGENHLNGLQALAYVRQRDGLPRGDLDRIVRQHEFLSAVFHKVTSAGTLVNPAKLTGILNSLADDMTLDDGTSTSDLITLGKNFSGIGSSNIGYFTIPTTGASMGNLGSVQIADPTKAQQIYTAIKNDQDPAHPTAVASGKASAAPTAQAKLTVPPSKISLIVENGSGISGQGRKAATDLRGVGFTVSSIENATKLGQSQTTVRYGSDKADSADTVAAAIPGSVAEADASLGADQIVVVTGSSYSGTQAVHVGTGTGAAFRQDGAAGGTAHSGTVHTTTFVADSVTNVKPAVTSPSPSTGGSGSIQGATAEQTNCGA